MLKENLAEVENNIAEACRRSGREREEVTLIAVSKTKPLSMVETIAAEGVTQFGENKVQEIRDKWEVHPEYDWHMIGHLQTNKVKYIVDKVKLIHSVDSLRLAEVINKEAAKKDVVVSILIEVNVAAEESKFGVTAEETIQLIEEISKLKYLSVKGLMTIAPFVTNPEDNRGHFQKLYKLSVDIKSKNIDNVNMDVLSMGMTNDYEIAIEEGATMVRVGTAIFGERNYNR